MTSAGSIVLLLLALITLSACTGKGKLATDKSKPIPKETLDLTKSMQRVGVGQRPLWSPDGQNFVFLHNGDLVLSKADGSAGSIILRASEYGFPENQVGEYLWAPDGQRLVFTLDSARRISAPKLYSFNLSQGRKQLLFSRPQQKFQTFYNLSWIGQDRLFFWANDVSSTQTFIFDTNTNSTRNLGVTGDMLSVAPDGTKMAYVQEDEGGLEVYLSDLDGQGAQVIASLAGLDSFIVHMTWSPDGKQLSLWGNGAVFIVDVHKKNAVTILTFPENDQYPEEVIWSKDSSHILVATTQHLYYGIPTQSQLKALSSGRTFASWSPDGQSVLFQKLNPANQAEIWVGGQQKVVQADLPELHQTVGKKEIELNTGPDDGEIVLPKASAAKLTNQNPEWAAINEQLNKYFLGQNWQGNVKMDRLYRLKDDGFYAVVIVYYLEGESYYPEAYEVLLQDAKQQFEVRSYEVMPFSPEFTP